MNRLYSFFNILVLTFFCSCLTACVDDGLGFDADDLREGETTLNLEAAFSPFAEGNLTRASLTPPGRGFNELSDLAILVYDKEGNIFLDEDGKPFIREITFDPNDVKDENRGESDTSNGKQPAESDTKSLKNIQLKLPFGEYYIIGVANLGSYTESSVSTSTYEELTTKYADACATLDGLRRIKVEWESDNYRNNREMLGYFADPEAQSPRASSTFLTVKVNRPGMQLRAWLRRCASKITIDFDGSALRENVYIYIKDARIYDLAKECTLGFGNAGTADESVADYNNAVINEEGLTQSSHHIEYGEGEDFSSWPCITKGEPYIMENNKKKDFHTQESEALYFYENMQGTGKDRTPVPDLSSGNVAGGFNEKDGKEFGTYIEVTAHYHSDADGNIADYDIKYRFMIGKDVTTNYDAERNYHYKLTLKFRGNANEYHWHIDYDEPEGFDVPNPWYVSYLYNHDAMLPFKYTPPAGWKVKNMTAEIITNPWYPSDFSEQELTDPKKEITPVVPSGDEPEPYLSGDNKYDGNGFLSLRVPKDDNVITDIDASGKAFSGYSYTAGTPGNEQINEAFYRGISPSNSTVDKSKRVIIENGQVKNDSGNERENIIYKKDKESYTIDIPLFTRAKVMVKQTGYSGNNPFVGYQRIARVKLSVTLEKEGEEDKEDFALVNVVQVRRVVNPKGVYRSSNNSTPFHVKMMFLSSDDIGATFQTIKSRGPWTAEIIGDKNFITLDGKQTVSGATGTDIDFYIRFNRMASSGNKNAVVRIRYHNYTCVHLIFVRQGYDAQAIANTGVDFDNKEGGATPTKWNTFNMISENVMADDPRDEGSMFKFGTSDTAIDAINNVYHDGNGNEIYYNLRNGQFTPDGPFRTVDADGKLSDNTTEWSAIAKDEEGFTSGAMAKTATMRDFEQLYLTPNVQFGYGVLYADGATETQSTIEMAYGYSRHDNSDNAKKKGMRGMFAYYWDRTNSGDNFNGKNLFFPIGRSGYGHRKNTYEEGNNGKGVLRYSANRCKPASQYGGVYANFQHISPLFESIYRRPGAIYWARNKTEDRKFLEWNGDVTPPGGTSIAYGLDINYFTFDVNAITGANVDSGGDACFVRTVVDN